MLIGIRIDVVCAGKNDLSKNVKIFLIQEKRKPIK